MVVLSCFILHPFAPGPLWLFKIVPRAALRVVPVYLRLIQVVPGTPLSVSSIPQTLKRFHT